MNIKEAIEFIEWAEDVFSIWNKLEEPNIEFIKQGNEVIELLQRGEKYKEMWKKAKEDYGEVEDNCPEGFKDRWLFAKTIKLYEQKYFPEGELNDTIPK